MNVERRIEKFFDEIETYLSLHFSSHSVSNWIYNHQRERE